MATLNLVEKPDWRPPPRRGYTLTTCGIPRPIVKGEGRTRRPATVVRYMAALSHAFTIAVKEWEWLDDSPLRKVSKPQEPRGRVRFLSDEEREILLASCKQSKAPYLYPLVVLALSTGARRGELLGLTWGI